MERTPAAAEERRLAALKSYDLFGSAPETEYDQFTDLGAHLFGVPICLISLIGRDEQWLKAHHGVDICSTPRDISFCDLTLTTDSPFIVPDMAADARFRDNPLVTGPPHIRFYAGAPLINAEGIHLGAFCIIDTIPRDSVTDEECRLLVHLAAMVVARMDKRRALRRGKTIGGFADATGLALVTANTQGLITFWNRAAETLFGYTATEAIGRSLDLIVPPHFLGEHRAGLRRVADGGTSRLSGKTVEVLAMRKDGSEFPIQITIAAWQGAAGREFGAHIQDITERREREQRLRHLAHHDPLTGLLNRLSFREHLEACLHGNAATLLALDLDGFKSVNDNFGHAVGDVLLQAIAIRLTSVIEESGMLARIGGDEFAVLLSGLDDPAAAAAVADSLLDAFAEPFQVAGHVLQLGLSIGVALSSPHDGDVDEFLLHADMALLAVKKDGGRRMRFFDAGMGSELAARRAFKDELIQATEQHQWELYYEPQVHLGDGVLIGVEALLRWHHPTRGLLLPASFLPVLENHLMAYEVGSWVVDEACRQLAAWRRRGWKVPRIGVNLFAIQLTSGTLEQVIRTALQRHGLQPDDLEIEITEKIALRPHDDILPTLNRLRDAGVAIAFDDFGTGFASLTTLKHVPVSRLKIDRSFVEDICEAPHSAAIVGAILSLAERLGLEVVAEGIETEAQRDKLIGLGCKVGQGYLFGRAVDASQEPRWAARAA